VVRRARFLRWASLALSLGSIPACVEAAEASADGGIPITAFGRIGTPDDSTVFQAAADAAEKAGQPLVIPAGTVVNLRGTVYLGNLTLHAQGAVINCLIDGDFHQRGTADRANEGVILTKSATGAGYGMATVRIAFDSLTINTVRAVDGAGAKSGLLLENVSGFTGNTMSVTARGTGRSEVDPVDFYSGVQGVRLGTVRVAMANGGGQGGMWIRNFSPSRATSNIDIGTVDASGSTGDELLSIFTSGSPQTDVNNVHIGHFIGHPDGGGGMALSIFRNAGDYDPTKMRNITIDNVDVTVGAVRPTGATGGFAVKVQKATAQLGAVKLTYNGAWSPSLPFVFGVRFAPGAGQTAPLEISSVDVVVNARNQVPPRSAAILYGPISTGRFAVSGPGSGFRQAAWGVANLRGVDIRSGPFSREAVFGGHVIGGNVEGTVRP